MLDDRPYCYYDAVVGAEMSIEEYPVTTQNGMKYSGIFTVTLIAFEPFGKLTEKTIAFGDTSGAYEETGLLPEDMMPAAPTPDAETFMVYNPGTEKCGLILKLGGETGKKTVTFTNEATAQKCTVTGLTDVLTTDSSMWVEVDGERMQTRYGGAATSEINYLYHDDGYITLVPAEPVKDLAVAYEAGSGTVRSLDGSFEKDMEGKYIYVEGDWRKVSLVRDEWEMETIWRAAATGSESTTVAAVNRITITRETGATLSRIDIDYQPKVR